MQRVDFQGYLVIQNLQGSGKLISIEENSSNSLGRTMTKKNCTCKQAQFL